MKHTESKTKAAGMHVRVATRDEHGWFDAQMGEHHYLGAGRSVGDYLRQVVECNGEVVALLAWGPACYALKDRDLWIGWSANQRIERLKLVVQNRRFLLLVPKGEHPNLASQVMGAVLRVIQRQWAERFGYEPLLAETFTDPEAYGGTCYKASNWEPVGMSAGYSRHRADFYIDNDHPKKLWLRPLEPDARRLLKARELPERCRAGVGQAPSGVLPVLQPQMLSLLKVLAKVPDPRRSNVVYRIGPVLTIIAMALMAGRREVAEIARFATLLRQGQREQLGLPCKKDGRFRKVPNYSVFYEVLRRVDPEVFARILSGWLMQNASQLPQAVAMDGKMIRDHIGTLTIAGHETGAPVAFAIQDQKEGTRRCEQVVALELVAGLPSLDGRVVTADALHCGRDMARCIQSKGGDYVLQVKANQPSLLKHAQRLDAIKGTPFLK